jgi:hypothetical protein
VALPSRCGFPDGSNTGVPSGTVLRSVPGDVSKGVGWHYDSRGWVSVDGDGAVLEGLILPAVEIVSRGATVRRCRIVSSGEGMGVSLRHSRDATIEDSEIYSPDRGSDRLMVGIKDTLSDATGTRILRNDIWHAGTGIQVYQGLVEGNYIHDMGFKPGDHINGMTSNGGVSGQLTIRGNTVLNQIGQTDAVSLFEDFGEEKNRTIEGNLLAGGGYTVYGGANVGRAPTSNIRIVNNRFSRVFFPQGGSFGPVAAFNAGGVGNVWSGNVWDDDTRASITSDGRTRR